MWLGRQPIKPVEDVRLGRIVIRLHFSDSIGFELAPNLEDRAVANDVGKNG